MFVEPADSRHKSRIQRIQTATEGRKRKGNSEREKKGGRIERSKDAVQPRPTANRYGTWLAKNVPLGKNLLK